MFAPCASQRGRLSRNAGCREGTVLAGAWVTLPPAAGTLPGRKRTGTRSGRGPAAPLHDKQ